MTAITYQISPQLSDEALNDLFASAWPEHRFRPFSRVHQHSLAYIAAFDGDKLTGYVNLAWDGGIHAFILDTTVRDTHQRLGIGRELVTRAAVVAKQNGIEWLHVDYEPHLEPFYQSCGFIPTKAGLINLSS